MLEPSWLELEASWLALFPLSTDRFGPQAKVAQMLSHTVVESIAADAGDLASKAWHDLTGRKYTALGARELVTPEYLPGITDENKKAQAQECLTKGSTALAADLAYKARPLDGIWATAPYLHNGSVPTLYDMLLPARVQNVSTQNTPAPVQCDRDGADKPCTRPEDFSVGSREFDPRLVGFVSAANLPGTFEFKVYRTDGTPILGNYNNGHYFGTALNDQERWALVEYLKTL